MRVGDFLSKITDVTSGVVEGSILGPDLFKVLADSLCRRLRLHSFAYMDGFKSIACVAEHTLSVIQSEVNIVANWSKEFRMPLSIEKSGILHCGPHQSRNVYLLCGHVLPTVDTFVDLGVVRNSATVRWLPAKPLRYTGQSGTFFFPRIKNYYGQHFVVTLYLYLYIVRRFDLFRCVVILSSLKRFRDVLRSVSVAYSIFHIMKGYKV